jgi:hypothetical protein
MAKGKKKTLTDAQRGELRQRLEKVRHKRWQDQPWYDEQAQLKWEEQRRKEAAKLKAKRGSPRL